MTSYKNVNIYLEAKTFVGILRGRGEGLIFINL
jgi:hypothetical protein